MWQRRNRSVEPKMDGRNRRRLDPFDAGQLRHCRPKILLEQRADAAPRDGDNDTIEYARSTIGQHHRSDAMPVAFDASDGRSQMDHNAPICKPLADPVVKNRSQRQARQYKIAGPARREKTVHENFPRSGERSTIDGLAQGANQHHRPELFDGPLRLVMAAEPRTDGFRFRQGSVAGGLSPPCGSANTA